jgi:hypothetical protein
MTKPTAHRYSLPLASTDVLDFQHVADKWFIFKSFFDRAHEMSDLLQKSIATGAALQIWDYCYSSGNYGFLQMDPSCFFSDDLLQSFSERLLTWSAKTFGIAWISPPVLTAFIDGCHREPLAGDSGESLRYVFSLTRLSHGSFSGGEAVLMETGLTPNKRKSLFRNLQIERLLQLDWNEFLVFDARIPHGIREVRGAKHPLQSRLQLEGSIGRAEHSIDNYMVQPHGARSLKLHDPGGEA